MTEANNLAGMRFGSLTATARVTSDITGKAQWHCVCDCGKPHTARADNLIHGRTKRCAACRGGSVGGKRAKPDSVAWRDAKRCMTIMVAMMPMMVAMMRAADDGGNDNDDGGTLCANDADIWGSE